MDDFLLLDGSLLRTVDPMLLRATTYGHFTSLQVRDGCVDGLDLHFERLDRSTREVFGQPLPAAAPTCAPRWTRHAPATFRSG